MSEKRQKNQLQLAFMMEGRDESPRDIIGGTEALTAKGKDESPAEAERLMEEILDPENLMKRNVSMKMRHLCFEFNVDSISFARAI